MKNGKTAAAAADAPRDLRIVAGLALMYVWTWLHYWGGPYSLRNLTIGPTNARWAAHVVLCALAVGAVAAMSCRMGGRRLLGAVRAASLVSGLAGTGIALMLVLAPPGEPEALLLAAVLSGMFTGICEGLLLALWCTTSAAQGMRATLKHNMLAMVASGLLFVGCNLVPTPVALALGMLCPVAQFWCSRGCADLAAVFEPSPDAPEAPSQAAPAPRPAPSGLPASFEPLAALVRDRPFAMLGAIAFVFGASCGFINASFEVVPEAVYRTSCHLVVAGTILAAALIYLTAFVLKLDAWQLVFRTSLPLMAVSYLLFPYEAFGYVGPGIHALGYQYFFIAFWSLLGSTQLRRDVPAARSVSVGLFFTEAGAVLGLALWNALCAGVGGQGLAVVSSVVSFVVLLVAVSFEKPAYGWGDVRPGTAVAPAGPDSYTAAVEHIRSAYGLSPRETDVFARLGRGRNRQIIADELGISLETAKTHASNVYRKLGVHSQQELLDVIEMTCEALEREGR